MEITDESRLLSEKDKIMQVILEKLHTAQRLKALEIPGSNIIDARVLGSARNLVENIRNAPATTVFDEGPVDVWDQLPRIQSVEGQVRRMHIAIARLEALQCSHVVASQSCFLHPSYASS
jgi:hypothetical protein